MIYKIIQAREVLRIRQADILRKKADILLEWNLKQRETNKSLFFKRG